jgi:hypothetical protein
MSTRTTSNHPSRRVLLAGGAAMLLSLNASAALAQAHRGPFVSGRPFIIEFSHFANGLNVGVSSSSITLDFCQSLQLILTMMADSENRHRVRFVIEVKDNSMGRTGTNTEK